MTKYIYISKIFLVLYTLTLSSCAGDFILDPVDPRLPKYTEDGNNVAGAFINQEVWKSIVHYELLKVIDKPVITSYNNNDSLIIKFDGEKTNYSVSLEFHLTGLNITKFDDLIFLKGRKIPLDGLKNVGICITYKNSPHSLYSFGAGGIGQLYFRNVNIDKSSEKAILSGTFGFTSKDSICGTIEISYGRFDYVIQNNSNFLIN